MAAELVPANSIGWREAGGWRCRRGQRRRDRVAHDGLTGSTEAPPTELRLSQASVGSTVTVIGIGGGESFRGKVMGIGIHPGVSLSVVGGGGSGRPLLIALPGSRCMLDQRSSELITVRNKSPRPERKRR